MSEKERKGRRWRVTRRGFLIGLGATTATLAIGVAAGRPRLYEFMGEMVDSGNGAFGSIPNTPSLWLEITPENQVRFFVPKVEMGTGIHTTIGQIAADELEVSMEQMEVIQASTSRGFGGATQTGNSDAISTTYMPVREAAAALRETLKQEAANQFGVTVSALSVADGEIWETTVPENRVTYGEIIADVDVNTLEVPEEISLKDQSNFRYIGQSVQRVDFKSKLTGEAVYGYDARVPDMLYGAVARPPKIEATLKSVSSGSAAEQDGVVHVLAEDDFAGVVATSRRAAYAGVRNMDVEWDEGHLWQQEELDDLVTVTPGAGITVQREGNVARNLTGTIIQGEYRSPFAAHAHLEAQAALVDVKPNKVTAWVSTQSPSLVGSDIASAIDVDEEIVEVIPTYLGSGLGRKLNVEVALEAARLSKASGKPVHVGWDRAEDMRHGFFRPPTHHVLTGSLENGRIHALLHEQISSDSLFLFFPPPLRAVFGADLGAYRGGFIQYDGIPHRQLNAEHAKLPIPTGPWRGLGLLANTFAVESFIDELAHAANADPLQFRLDHMAETTERSERFKRSLTLAGERVNWGASLPEGHALGIATNVDVNTIVTQVAEVSVDNGRIRVHKVTSIVDPGLVVNPDGATAQTQGAVMMGLSSAFFEEITVKNGIIEASNFDRYPLLTMKDAPDLDVMLIESGNEPWGMGEPPIGPIAAAVGNAVFALTGQRLRQLPMRLTA